MKGTINLVKDAVHWHFNDQQGCKRIAFHSDDSYNVPEKYYSYNFQKFNTMRIEI